MGLDMGDADTVFERCLDACHKIKKVGWARCAIGMLSNSGALTVVPSGLPGCVPQDQEGMPLSLVAQQQRGSDSCASWAAWMRATRPRMMRPLVMHGSLHAALGGATQGRQQHARKGCIVVLHLQVLHSVPSPQEMGDLDGITCFCELAVPLASRLCERLGLPTNSPQVGVE